MGKSEDDRADAQAVDLKKITKEYMNNTKVFNKVIGQFHGAEIHKPYCISALKDKKIITAVIIVYEDEVKTSKSITAFDIAVMDAVYTLTVYGYWKFTPIDVARVMSGEFSQHFKFSPQKIGAITKSLQKLRRVDVEIDCTAEFASRKKIGPGVQMRRRSYLLPLEETQITLNNHHKANGFELIKMPVLYEYATEISQMISFSVTLLETDMARESDDVMIIKRYLIKRIEQMKHNPALSRKIIYDYEKDGARRGMFEDLGFAPDNYKNRKKWRTKKSKINSTVADILNKFQQQRYITGFELIKGGNNEIRGIEISP